MTIAARASPSPGRIGRRTTGGRDPTSIPSRRVASTSNGGASDPIRVHEALARTEASKRSFFWSPKRRASVPRRLRAAERDDADAEAPSSSSPDPAGGGASSASSSSSSVMSFLCPLLKAFGGGDAAAPRSRALEVATSGFASIARLPFGTTVDEAVLSRPASALPKEPIVLYEFEACPFCRRVREALTQLDLTVEVRPCPKESVTHRAEVEALGGKLTFPFLVDPNTGTKMYESADIVAYLYDTYGNGAPYPEKIVSTTVLTGWMPTLLRAGRGMTRYPGATLKEGVQPLTLYNYEGNQFARLVREALCELELPYVLFNCGKGSPKRRELTAVAGEGSSVPYLVDPNTGESLGESEEIVAYLFRQYGGYTGDAESAA